MTPSFALIGQIEQAAGVVQEATRYGWEAGLLAFIVVSSMGAIGYALKVTLTQHSKTESKMLADAQTREVGLSDRVSRLEDMIRTELLGIIKTNSETIGKVLSAADSICQAADRMTQTLEKFSVAMESRPCLLTKVPETHRK
jgi:hypothetical protein